MKTIGALVFVASCLIAATVKEARAWGNEGHAVICEIAFRELTTAAREKVKDLIEGDEQFTTFAEACSWPDRPRKRRTEHYVNLPRTMSAIASPSCPLATKCLFTAIEQDSAILAGASSSDDEKLKALKYLGHWIGDIHQPLHVSFEDDRGGNSIGVRGLCWDDLHANWDSCLVKKRLNGKTPMQYGVELQAQITAAERRAWGSSEPVVWAAESYQITIWPAFGYCMKRNGACQYDPDHVELDDQEEKTVIIDQAYVDASGPVIDEQMKKAGLRLANRLNQILAH